MDHQRNANKNHKEIATHTCQNAVIKIANKFWGGHGEKGTSLPSVAMKIGSVFAACSSVEREWAAVIAVTSLTAPQHAGSSWTRAHIYIPCFGRQVPNHWTTREFHAQY